MHMNHEQLLGSAAPSSADGGATLPRAGSSSNAAPRPSMAAAAILPDDERERMRAQLSDVPSKPLQALPDL